VWGGQLAELRPGTFGGRKKGHQNLRPRSPPPCPTYIKPNSIWLLHPIYTFLAGNPLLPRPTHQAPLHSYVPNGWRTFHLHPARAIVLHARVVVLHALCLVVQHGLIELRRCELRRADADKNRRRVGVGLWLAGVVRVKAGAR
jgi:hypothetical protein